MLHRFLTTRARTLALVAPLSDEDCQVQSMPDASPAKWHLAHTTWFFETFVLEAHERGFRPFEPAFRVLFNSYYNTVGDKHPRPQRGLVTRPGLATVRAYRAQVDERMARLLDGPRTPALDHMVELGLQHEQQHQELLLTDLLHLLSCNPLGPVYDADAPLPAGSGGAEGWATFDGGIVEIGHGGPGFCFDNEQPRHRTLLEPHALARRLVDEGDWRAFIDDGGYRDPRWWLSAGWDWVQQQHIEAPLHWRQDGDGAWQVFTLRGLRPLQAASPVLHISCYEADAYARWRAATDATCAGARLPTEAEWESAAARSGSGLAQCTGAAWQWTASPYVAYPGFKPWAGAAGEYNGKFMINQQVLRGGSLATPASHTRPSYRNFFPADARWQFTGLRLARDLG
ncbi:ergothioneine biosynthesis protein EgtB [Ideonella sp. A 288]|uniref:ergothioneine biosynthesis protein EgtB n=1 Tax=Ideonella sp. A 288 TaxID=1962181 RepID=UPI001F46C342|nr:ergothioneine biosynthesis protein EgtB [Ideonella sp. A 288]